MNDIAHPGGLSEAEVRQRLLQAGPNELQDRERRGFARTLAGVFTEPMFLLLLVAAAVYLLVGDLGEGLLLATFAVATVGLVVAQERRSAHALDALRELAAPQVRVLRDGTLCRRPARELVPGDVFALAEGERVAADGRVHQATSLAVDESLLTGESVPVRKRAAPGPAAGEAAAAPGGDDSAWVYAGTLATAGHAWVEVTATGRATQVGRIGASLAGLDPAPTPLQQQLQRLVRAFGLAALAASALLVVGYGLARGDWLQGLLSGLAFAMAMLPEEFPLALAVFLALGAWRLARMQVLARRPAVVEALGAATVLAVDKTGTLTENRMSLRRLVTDEADTAVVPGQALPEPVHRLLEMAMLASHRDGADPMDRAVLQLGDHALAGSEHLHPPWRMEREHPITPELLVVSQAWRSDDGRLRVAAKGAPEAVASLCGLDEAANRALHGRVRALAAQGLRVLAVAEAETDDAARPPRELAFRWLGLLGFQDPLRASVPAAVAQARGAGIAVLMITGDHADTALAVAAEAGIDVGAGALGGDELATLDDAALDAAVRRVRVFARVRPEQKLRLVQALQRQGHTVAMTGDGVNDAPALKAAHIGIAMGQRGTDVAREAAGLVLMDEDFGRIVGGVRMGRRIADNLRRVMTYITAIHVPIAGLSLLPLLMGLPPLMLPAHVVITEMVVDPVCSLAFESAPEDPRSMQRPPRARGEGLVGWPMLRQGLLQGAVLLAVTLAVYALALRSGRSVEVARTLAVLGLTLGNLGLVAVNLTAGLGARALTAPGTRAFRVVAAVALGALAAALAIDPVRHLLRFETPTATDLALALGAVLAAVALLPLLQGSRARTPAPSATAGGG